MAAELHITPSRATSSNGLNLDGAKWFFYRTGTTTPQSVYTTAALSAAHSNPVTADAAGKFPAIYFDSTLSYRGVLKTSDEVTTIYDIDPINAGVLAELSASNGASLVNYKRTGSGANGATRSQLDVNDKNVANLYDWDGSGANDTVRFERALANVGANVLCIPARSTPYAIRGILDLKTNGMTLLLEAGAVLNLDVGVYNVDFSQSNFGNALRISGDDISIIGRGPSSRLQLVNGTDGNAVGWLQGRKGYIGNLTIDGGKSTTTAIVDDSFQSGLSIIGYKPNITEYSEIIVDSVRIRNCTQYGANIYGDRAGNVTFQNCYIYNNGKTGNDLSVGHGIASTRGNQNISFIGGALFGNFGHGFFGASAGQPASGLKIIGADIYNNGKRGISITEEQQWGVDPGNAGTKDILIANNRIFDNGEDGIRIGTYNSASAIGPLTDGKIIGNIIRNNRGYGIIAQSENVNGKRLEDWDIAYNTIEDNGNIGLTISANCRSIRHSNNDVSGNTGGDIVDSQEYWTAVTFTGGYYNAYGAPYPQCAYRIDDGVVTLRGALAGSAGGSAFTLPAGFRPKSSYVLAPDARFYVHTNGNLEVTTGTQPWILDGISFEAQR